MKIYELIDKANKILKENNDLDANIKTKLLLSSVLNVDNGYLNINFDKEVDKEKEDEFLLKLELLKSGKPVQYIINKQSFYGYDFFVNENVLIPQPDTEILVEEVITYIENNYKNYGKVLNVLDLCTGSGIIGICLKKKLGNKVNVYASDISEKALEVAKINAEKLGVEINFICSDLFENLDEIKFDIIVSNPPYIKTDVIKELSKEVQNEPFIALDGKEDGLYFYRKIIIKSKGYLEKNGKIFFEIGYDQSNEVENLFKENNFIDIYTKKDYGNNDRIVVGKKGE